MLIVISKSEIGLTKYKFLGLYGWDFSLGDHKRPFPQKGGKFWGSHENFFWVQDDSDFGLYSLEKNAKKLTCAAKAERLAS